MRELHQRTKDRAPTRRTTDCKLHPRRWRERFGLLAVGCLGAALAPGQAFRFEFDPAGSGLDALLRIELNTSGTLIGNYDATLDPPAGTRTKPGLFGAFGPTENVPVPCNLRLRLGGDLRSSTRGSFSLRVDRSAGTAELSNYRADYLGGSPVVIDADLVLRYNTFRTRSPDSVFIGGFPLTLPLGQLNITALTAEQVEGPAGGVLEPLGPGIYRLTIALVVVTTVSFDGLGGEATLPSAPTPLVLTAELRLEGTTAELLDEQPVDLVDTSEPLTELPALPLPLPTVLPPGEVANLILNLTLTDTLSSLVGRQSLRAIGIAGQRGDLNCDDVINFDDIEPFVVALIGPAAYQKAYPDCDRERADLNQDGLIDFDDIDSFVACLITGSCD